MTQLYYLLSLTDIIHLRVFTTEEGTTYPFLRDKENARGNELLFRSFPTNWRSVGAGKRLGFAREGGASRAR